MLLLLLLLLLVPRCARLTLQLRRTGSYAERRIWLSPQLLPGRPSLHHTRTGGFTLVQQQPVRKTHFLVFVLVMALRLF